MSTEPPYYAILQHVGHDLDETPRVDAGDSLSLESARALFTQALSTDTPRLSSAAEAV